MKIFIIRFILRAILSGVFIIAGYRKILQPEVFSVAITNYQMVPQGLVNILALGLPVTEVGAGICLILGIKPRVMGWLLCGLLVIFIGAISYALWIGVPIDCGCSLGGEATKGSMWVAFFRDWILLVVALGLIAIYSERAQTNSPKIEGAS